MARVVSSGDSVSKLVTSLDTACIAWMTTISLNYENTIMWQLS